MKSNFISFCRLVIVVCQVSFIDSSVYASGVDNCVQLAVKLSRSLLDISGPSLKIRNEIFAILEEGNEYGFSPLMSKGLIATPDEMKYLYSATTNPGFKFILLKEAREQNIAIVENYGDEVLQLLRMILHSKLVIDVQAGDEMPDYWALQSMADFGTLEDIPLLQQLYQRFGKYSQHVILNVINEITAKSRGEGILGASVWDKSPLKSEIEAMYADADQLIEAFRNFDIYWRYYTRDDLYYLLNLTTKNNNGAVTIHIIANNYKFRGNFHYDHTVIAGALQYVRAKIQKKLANLGSEKIGFPWQEEFNFLAQVGDMSDIGSLQALKDKSFRAEIEMYSDIAIKAIKHRESLIKLSF